MENEHVTDNLLHKRNLWSWWPLAVVIVLGSLGFFLFFLNTLVSAQLCPNEAMIELQEMVLQVVL
jgi:hypothetical protein